MMLSNNIVNNIIRIALLEDIGTGDVTTNALVPADKQASLKFVAREMLSVAGLQVAGRVFEILAEKATDPDFRLDYKRKDGDVVPADALLLAIHGNARSLLKGERVALNLLQRMSGVATLTKEYVDLVSNTKAKILDTRKTIPGLRMLDKYAVTCGGGVNHRFGLYDAVMIKDNHVALAGGVKQAMERVKSASTGGIPIILECDTLEQVKDALTVAPDRILLDNMSLNELREAVALSGGRIPLEASGGVSLETVRDIAETGVDFISVGAITHSAPAVDIGADVEL